ncbi:MAG: FixH family protein [Gammaproteobacteria bacterium]|nr:FixH family protein [Gammaproteobacteria bacterium]MDX5375345.1 FixH family protein [Gammaproteobacteria bacterium]
MHANTPPPWYRQFWPWVLIGLPASAVAASLFTIHLALQTDDTLVVDEYYKAGLAINQELGRDRVAAEQGLSAELALTEAGLRVRLTGDAAGTPPQRLRVSLIHPTLAGRDRDVTLLPGADGAYHGQLKDPGRGEWRVLLMPENRHWRLQGRWNPQAQGAMVLEPAVQ